MDPFLPDDAKLTAIREALPSTGSGIRLDTTVAGPFPAETDRALREADDWELRVGRGGPDRADDLAQRADEARSVIAAVLAATPDRVLLAPGPVAAISVSLAAAEPREQERFVVIGEIRDALLAGVRTVAASRGATIEFLPGGSDAALDQGTTLVVAAHVDAATGALLAAALLAARTHDTGALLVLDAAWTAGAVPLDAPGIGADIVLVDGHRWLLGPEGVTAAWVSERIDAQRAAALLDPLPRTSLLALARSVGWLLMYIGLPWAFERAQQLTARLNDSLSTVDGVEVLSPGSGLATTVVFRIARWPVEEAAAELSRRCFAVLDVDGRRGLLRAGVAAWLRDEELDRFLAAVGDLARHSPETLPRRPMLKILSDEGGDRGR